MCNNRSCYRVGVADPLDIEPTRWAPDRLTLDSALEVVREATGLLVADPTKTAVPIFAWCPEEDVEPCRNPVAGCPMRD